MNPLAYIIGVFLHPIKTIKSEKPVTLTGSLMLPIILILLLSIFAAGVSEILFRNIVPEQEGFNPAIFTIGISVFIWISLFYTAGFYSQYLPLKIFKEKNPPSHRKAMHDHGVIGIWSLFILLVICLGSLVFVFVLPMEIANMVILVGFVLIILDMAAYFSISCFIFFRYSKVPEYKRYKTIAPAVGMIALFLVGVLFLNPVVFPGLFSWIFG